MAVRTVSKANKEMAGMVVENDPDATDYKPLSNAVDKPPFDRKSEIERALVDLDVVTKTDIQAIFENRLGKWTNKL